MIYFAVMTPAELIAACEELCASGDKPTLDRVRVLVGDFYALPGCAAGGALHVVLDDGNLRTRHIEFCIKYAEDGIGGRNPVPFGAGADDRADSYRAAIALAHVLLRLTNSQRRRLYLKRF